MKKGFTLPETIMTMMIIPIILLSAVSILGNISDLVFYEQVESGNRRSTYDNIYTIMREIQSAERIYISEDKKQMEIYQVGISRPNKYIINEDKLIYGDKKILDIEDNYSQFEFKDKDVFIVLSLKSDDKNPTKLKKDIEFIVSPRSDTVQEGIL